MKLSGFTGTGTGKLGSSVFSVSGGQQIVRQYQGQVANPSTDSQVGQRSKMKLMAQIAAAMAAVIAFRKDGLVSARNQFISKNIANVSFDEGVATINLPAIQLTNGSRGIPSVTASRNGSTAINVALSSDASKACDRVVYCVFAKNAEDNLQLIDSTVVETAGEGGTFPGSLAYSANEVVVYAYGIKDADAAASSKYGNYGVTSGTQIATLVATSAISTADYAFTKTVGVQIAAV